MSFKNKKEYKREKQKWNSSALRQRSPAGYKTFKSNESTFKNKGKSKNDEVKIPKSKGDGIRGSSDFKSKKYKARDRAHTSNLQDLIDSSKKDRVQELKGLNNKRKPLTSKDLPDRPSKPTMPEISLPSGNLTTEKVANPSGNGGKMTKYSTSRRSNDQLKSDYKSAPVDYQRPKPKPKSKPSFNLPTSRIGALGVPSTKKAKGVRKK